jgi:hypothetical protein
VLSSRGELLVHGDTFAKLYSVQFRRLESFSGGLVRRANANGASRTAKGRQSSFLNIQNQFGAARVKPIKQARYGAPSSHYWISVITSGPCGR